MLTRIAPRSRRPAPALIVERGQRLRDHRSAGRAGLGPRSRSRGTTRREWLSSGRTIDYANTIYLTTGHTLYSNRSRPMWTIVEDTVGRHDFLLTPCSPETFTILYKTTGHHPSCFENLVARPRAVRHRARRDPDDAQRLHERRRAAVRRAAHPAAALARGRPPRAARRDGPDRRRHRVFGRAVEQRHASSRSTCGCMRIRMRSPARRDARACRCAQHPHRRSGVAQDAAAVRHAAEDRRARRPRASCTPRARRARAARRATCCAGKTRRPPPRRRPTSATRRRWQRRPTTIARQRPVIASATADRQHRELRREARRARELVVRLPHALRPEVPRGRRAPRHEHVVAASPRARPPRRPCARARGSRTSRGRRSRRSRRARSGARRACRASRRRSCG